MIGLITFFHVLACLLLVTVILMQSGRGGGLTEGFAAAESMFGAKTNTMMVKITTALAVFFLVTSLTLAFLSSKKGESLMEGSVVPQRVGVPAAGTEMSGQEAVGEETAGDAPIPSDKDAAASDTASSEQQTTNQSSEPAHVPAEAQQP